MSIVTEALRRVRFFSLYAEPAKIIFAIGHLRFI